MIQVTLFFNITLGEFQITSKNSISDEMRCFDRFLSGEDIALKALTKITQRTKFLARQTSFLDSSTLHTLEALVQSHCDYSAISWYTELSQHLKNRLQMAQNKLTGVILKVHPLTHFDVTHFEKLKWLRVEKRIL